MNVSRNQIKEYGRIKEPNLEIRTHQGTKFRNYNVSRNKIRNKNISRNQNQEQERIKEAKSGKYQGTKFRN